MDKDEFSRRAREATQSLYRVACAYLASPPDRDDAVQETLLRAWEKRRTLRKSNTSKPGSRAFSSAYAWICSGAKSA